MKNKAIHEIIESKVVYEFTNSAQKHEAGLVDFVAKSCGYPTNKAWRDQLDMSLGIYLEDYAREKDLAIAFFHEDDMGYFDIIYTDEVVDRFSSWMKDKS